SSVPSATRRRRADARAASRPSPSRRSARARPPTPRAARRAGRASPASGSPGRPRAATRGRRRRSSLREALPDEHVEAVVRPRGDPPRLAPAAAEELRQEPGRVVAARPDPEVAAESRLDALRDVVVVERAGQRRARARLTDAARLLVRVVGDLVVAEPEPAQ